MTAPRRTALLLLAALAAALVPLLAPATPAAADPGSASGRLDFDREGGGLDDFDLTYTVEVSDTTPDAGSDVTVTITWDEFLNLQPFGYADVNLCWDAPAGWAGAGPAPEVDDVQAFTPEGTPVEGEVVGADVPGVPSATADFASASAVNERVDISSYLTDAGRVYRFCAHTDSIDSRLEGLVDTADDISGTMTVTLEAPASGPADVAGLLPTSAYVTGSPLEDGSGLPADPDYVPLGPPQSPGLMSQTLGGTMAPVRYDYADSDGAASPPITVTPQGPLLTYALDQAPTNGDAVVDPDGGFTYTPDAGFIGQDTFTVAVSDGEGSTSATVTVDVLPNEAAVSVTKSADETSVLVGEPIHYTVEVRVTGAVPVTQLTVSDPNAPGCAAEIAELAVQATETIECTYVPGVDDVGTYTNVATAASPDLDGPAESNAVDVEVVNAATPRLEITKSTTQTSVEAGGPLTYEIEVTNTGGVPLTGVTVQDANAPDCERAVGGLAVGARSVYDCTLVTTPAMVGNRTNVATADSNETEPVSSGEVVVAVTPADGTTNVGYQCTPPGLDPIATTIPVTASDDTDPAEPGQTVTWDFRTGNPSIATGIEAELNWIQIEYPRPPGLTDVDLQLVNPPGQVANPAVNNTTRTVTAGAVRFRTPNSGTITVAANGNLTYNGQPVVLPVVRITGAPTEGQRGQDVRWRTPRILVNVQTANIGNVACNPNNPNTTVVSTRVAPANPILDVDKTAGQQAALPDQTIAYQVVVRNRGNVELTGVSVADPVAPDCARDLGTLAPGATETIDCSRVVTLEDEGRLRNIATADSDQTGSVASNPADVVVSTEAIAGLTVGLSTPSPTVGVDEPVPWTVQVQNVGNVEVTGLSLDADDASDCDAQEVPTSLGVGGSVTVECATPTEGLLQPFDRRLTVANQVTVTADDLEPVTSDEVVVTVPLPPTGWTDVQPWYAAAADWLDHWDLATGFRDGTRFRGNNPITRAEVLRMVYRLSGSPTPPNPPTHSFTDVPRWIEDAVAWAAQDPDGDGPGQPLMTGLTPTRFGPNDAITRAQAVRLLFRYAGTVGPQTVPSPPTHGFTDVPAWVADAVAWAAVDPDADGPLQPLMTGLTPTRFGPDTDITRAQVARVLYRMADLLDL